MTREERSAEDDSGPYVTMCVGLATKVRRAFEDLVYKIEGLVFRFQGRITLIKFTSELRASFTRSNPASESKSPTMVTLKGNASDSEREIISDKQENIGANKNHPSKDKNQLVIPVWLSIRLLACLQFADPPESLEKCTGCASCSLLVNRRNGPQAPEFGYL